ncbi:hypothetical protein BGZ76_002013 [Entomortierella beljakovae]|nr:hypothetical protein BGZ76_002013 [Entomortierella beljakovae]
MDKQYQDSVHLNALQGSHRHEGIAKLEKYYSSNMDIDHSSAAAAAAHYSCIDNNSDMRESKHYNTQQHQPSISFQRQYNPYSADQNLSSSDYQQHNHLSYTHYQQQQQQNHSEQRHLSTHQAYPSPISAGGDGGAGAYNNQHHRHYHHNHHQEGDNGHQQQQQQQRYHHYSQTEMSKLEAMFPPLHDDPSQVVIVENNKNPVTHPIVIDHPLQKQSMMHTLKSRSPNSKLSRQPHLLPPPILIPKDFSSQAQKHHQLKQLQQQHHQQQQQQQKDVEQQQLPSPSNSATSPESPSSLAIHLYVHHHHHHHPQQQQVSPPLSSNSSTPLLLLSPLTLPLESPSLPSLSPPLESEAKSHTISSSLPSPPSPTPEVIPLVAPRPLVPLLPSLNIPSSRVEAENKSNSLASPTAPPVNGSNDSVEQPWFSYPKSLGNSDSSASSTTTTTTTTTATKVDPRSLQQKLSAATLAVTSSNNSRRHRYHQRVQPHVSRPSLTDPVFGRQLLSTISQQELGRLYVHAAHHLHSHQPIRRYVLMKMMMTQAELIQYGRLRADMPRAPGPSTGSQPKKTRFGAEATIPKIPSKLGIFVMNMPRSRCSSSSSSSYSSKKKTTMATSVNNTSLYNPSSNSLKQRSVSSKNSLSSTLSPSMSSSSSSSSSSSPCSKSMNDSEGFKSTLLWTRSLSSLIGLSSNPLKRQKRRTSTGSLSDTDHYSLKRFEELELGEHSDEDLIRKRLEGYQGDDDDEDEEEEEEEEEEEDDGDIELESEDTFDEDEDDLEEEGNDEEDEDVEGGAKQSYWSLLRRMDNQSRRVSISKDPLEQISYKKKNGVHHTELIIEFFIPNDDAVIKE